MIRTIWGGRIHLDSTRGLWIAMQMNNMCDRARLLRSLPALARFLLRTNRLRSASRCTRAVRAVLLRIRGTRMHAAHYQTNRAHYADMQINVHKQPRVSRGTPHTCVHTFDFSLTRAIFERGLTRRSREITKLHSNGLISTIGAITIEYRAKLMKSKGRLQERFLIGRIIISSAKTC